MAENIALAHQTIPPKHLNCGEIMTTTEHVSDREMLIRALGGLREIGDALHISTPAQALNATTELAKEVHDHLVRTEGAA